MLTDDQKRRYARHLVLPGISTAGQEKLLASRVLIVGAGGLGSPLISYLAAAGVGALGIVDHDRVELSNLQRQTIHETGDIGRAKVESARNRIEELNPEVHVTLFNERLTESNAETIIAPFDLVADGCDNFATRFLVGDTCLRLKKPLISAAIRAFEGQLSTFKPYLGNPHPCYRCFVSAEPGDTRTCSETGILGPVAGVMGSLQAVEVIKELLGLGNSLSGYLLRYDGLSSQFRTSRLPKDSHCSTCNRL